MDRTKPVGAAPTAALREEIALQRKILLFQGYARFLPLLNALDALDAWVESVELRLSRIEGVKPWVGPMSVPAETTDEESRERELRRLALIARGNCEDCEG